MKQRDGELRDRLAGGLSTHEARRKLPGIAGKAERDCLIQQLVESARRIQYTSAIQNRDVWEARADPTNDAFDPVKAAVLRARRKEVEESFWLIFLFVQFGRNSKSGYRLLRDVYAGEGSGDLWTWNRISSDVREFKIWLAERVKVWAHDKVHRGVGGHRGHEKLELIEKSVETYVSWIAPPRSHIQLIQQVRDQCRNDPGKAFNALYSGMSVYRFGRLAKFDYLCMLGKLGLADIEPRIRTEPDTKLTGMRLLNRCLQG